MLLEWLIVISGVWLIVSPFVLGFNGAGRGNAIIVGFIVAVLALIDMDLEYRRESLESPPRPPEPKQ